MRRARSEDGFTIIELVCGMALGIIILLAAWAMLDTTLTVSRANEARVSAMQRSRLAMEDVVTQLRSEVCLGPGTPPIVSGTDTSITFYANLGTVDANPERRTLTLAGGYITESDYPGSGVAPALTFPPTPSRTRIVATRVEVLPGTPFLRYYAFSASGAVTPDLLLPTPLSAADAARVVRIGLTFRTQPDQSFRPGPTSLVLDDAVYVRMATPTDPRNGPQCG
jgi:type II secretory pathway pseudopilin PulG